MERNTVQTEPCKTNLFAEYGKSLMVHVDMSPGQRILDLGCGTGALTAELAKNGANVLGIDNSAEKIVKARFSHPELMFAEIDALELPYNEEFDTVFSNSVFHWIPNVDRLLAEIRARAEAGRQTGLRIRCGEQYRDHAPGVCGGLCATRAGVPRTLLLPDAGRVLRPAEGGRFRTGARA